MPKCSRKRSLSPTRSHVALSTRLAYGRLLPQPRSFVLLAPRTAATASARPATASATVDCRTVQITGTTVDSAEAVRAVHRSRW